MDNNTNNVVVVVVVVVVAAAAVVVLGELNSCFHQVVKPTLTRILIN